MAGYTAIVFADEKFPDHPGGSDGYIALAPIHGKPAIDWVVGALRASPHIDRLTVIGPQAIEELLCARYINRRLSPTSATVRHALAQIGGLSGVVTADLSGPGLLLAHCGCIELTADLIHTFICRFESRVAGIALPLIRPDERMSTAARTVSLPNSLERMMVSFGIGLARSSRFLAPFMHLYAQYGNSQREARHLSAYTVADAEKKLSEECGATTALLPFDDPSALRIISAPADCREAEARIPSPWQRRFSNAKVIMNPHAGAGMMLPPGIRRLIGMKQRTSDRGIAPKELAERIRSYLQEFNIDAEVIRPRSAGAIVEATRRCVKNSADVIVAAGGDGTINAVVNGLARSGVPLGIIPLGTANVLAIELAIPPELRSACQLVAQGSIHAIDLGCLNGRYFSCVAGIGFDAYVMRKAERESHLKQRMGGLAYVLAGALHFFHYRFRTIEITVDNETTRRSGYLVLIDNGKHYGGDLVVSPRARMDDGLLDVVVFKNKDVLSVMNYLQGFRTGTLPDFSSIEYLQGKEITVLRNGNHHVHIDGEYCGRIPVKVAVVPGALRVIS